MIHGLIFGCPLKNENHNCPFKSIRQLPVDKRIDFVNKLDKPEKWNLIQEHSKCLYLRESEVLIT